MKNASTKMFRFGDIVNTIYMVVASILIPVGIILLCFGYFREEPIQQLIDSGKHCLRWGIYMTVATILALIFVAKAKRELADESHKNVAPFIVTIVFGAVSHNPFYVLAGIFGLIAESKQKNEEVVVQEEPKMLDEPKEEETKE